MSKSIEPGLGFEELVGEYVSLLEKLPSIGILGAYSIEPYEDNTFTEPFIRNIVESYKEIVKELQNLFTLIGRCYNSLPDDKKERFKPLYEYVQKSITNLKPPFDIDNHGKEVSFYKPCCSNYGGKY